MDAVKTVDFDFYGEGSPLAVPFPSLETLKFEDMLITGLEKVFGLERIIIKDCPQLVSLTENANDMLYSCANMELSVCNKEEQLPCGMHGLQSLKDLHVESCPKLASFPEAGVLSSLRCCVKEL
ncbi:hypothetical protein GH714_004268 [Hevea brasiliensis]|uniref:Uncharacterized protein n=1 Tax=Hevea brasiliensis TaxID=3981 RepID=A0A6A6L052_HEVBR|nr:hypothetical protein GH714_004268 [Hevea brasiliensis]